jgi:hypothetical protein
LSLSDKFIKKYILVILPYHSDVATTATTRNNNNTPLYSQVQKRLITIKFHYMPRANLSKTPIY